ncbi:protein OCTOPUS-like [Aristolochia californica]|uniref:protein OCTOPUS-like n=1 Tax=Aristolochia californica TaxID=171875 RepID=UPI0035DC077D
MNLGSSSLTRCGKHPSQIFTGFCSSCLVERLASVDSVQRSPKPRFGDLQKPADCNVVAPELQRDSSDIRVRRTLLSLFQLDDSLDSECSSNICKVENSVIDLKLTENENEHKSVGRVSVINSTVRFCQEPDAPQSDRVGETESRPGANVSMETQACRLDLNVNSVNVEKRASMENENSKYRGGSFWSGSTFSRKLLRWRLLSACTKHLMQDKHYHGSLSVNQSETNQNFRHSCDQKSSCDSCKVHWEDPRHSWDGVMMGKTFAPTFMGIEEDPNSSIFYSRRSLPEGATMDESRLSTDTKDMYKTSTTTSYEEKAVSVGCIGEPNGEDQYEEARQDLPIPKIRRRNHGWSKVWNKNITSPLRDLIHKRENVLERSLSESWQESHKEKNVESIGAESKVKLPLPGSNTGSVRRQQSSVRSKNISSGEMLRLKPDLQKKKKEFLFGRSQSVHYSSPGNLDSGLLRFYLTPLRSSRRGTRRTTSRSLARGILGF